MLNTADFTKASTHAFLSAPLSLLFCASTASIAFAAIQVPSGSTGSIANDATFTVSASAQYCHIGGTFDVSTNVPFAGCLVFAKCETNGTITVRVKKFSGGGVGLNDVVFNVHRVTIN